MNTKEHEIRSMYIHVRAKIFYAYYLDTLDNIRSIEPITSV